MSSLAAITLIIEFDRAVSGTAAAVAFASGLAIAAMFLHRIATRKTQERRELESELFRFLQAALVKITEVELPPPVHQPKVSENGRAGGTSSESATTQLQAWKAHDDLTARVAIAEAKVKQTEELTGRCSPEATFLLDSLKDLESQVRQRMPEEDAKPKVGAHRVTMHQTQTSGSDAKLAQ